MSLFLLRFFLWDEICIYRHYRNNQIFECFETFKSLSDHCVTKVIKGGVAKVIMSIKF
jgi:hypothetical protein